MFVFFRNRMLKMWYKYVKTRMVSNFHARSLISELEQGLSATCPPLIPSTGVSVFVISSETTTDINLRDIRNGFRCPVLGCREHINQSTCSKMPSTSGATSTPLRPHVHYFGPLYIYTTYSLSTAAREQTP